MTSRLGEGKTAKPFFTVWWLSLARNLPLYFLNSTFGGKIPGHRKNNPFPGSENEFPLSTMRFSRTKKKRFKKCPEIRFAFFTVWRRSSVPELIYILPLKSASCVSAIYGCTDNWFSEKPKFCSKCPRNCTDFISNTLYIIVVLHTFRFFRKECKKKIKNIFYVNERHRRIFSPAVHAVRPLKSTVTSSPPTRCKKRILDNKYQLSAMMTLTLFYTQCG